MKTIRPALILGLLLFLPAFAHAQLNFTLTPPSHSGIPGDVLTFSGILTNLSADPVFLNGDNFTLDGEGLTLDETPFFENAPASLEGNASYTGALFTVTIDPLAPLQMSLGTFTILGGAADTDNSPLATQAFQIRVVAPEPTAGALLLSGGVLCLFAVRRKPIMSIISKGV